MCSSSFLSHPVVSCMDTSPTQPASRYVRPVMHTFTLCMRKFHWVIHGMDLSQGFLGIYMGLKFTMYIYITHWIHLSPHSNLTLIADVL